MWTEADRSTYRQAGDRLPSDLSDGEWERLAQLIPPAKPGGRPRKTDMRSAMNAIFYLLRTGCPWRYLPGRVFPPRSTVYNIFRAFQRQGVWEAIWEELRAALRERLGRERARAPASSTASRSSRPKRGMRERRSRRSGLRRRQEGEGAQDPRSGRYRRLAPARGGSSGSVVIFVMEGASGNQERHPGRFAGGA